MPELPEVETVRRHLEHRILHRKVESCWTSGKSLREPLSRGFSSRFRGGSFVAARRIAKFLYLDWESSTGERGRSLLSHLGMTGQFLFRKTPVQNPLPHTHVRWRFADGSILYFRDPRRFGLMRWVDRDTRPSGVGIDPTETEVGGELLYQMLRKSRMPIKAFLLDQKKIAGLGNIYACEALFRAGISPRRLSARIDRLEANRLAVAMMDTLSQAVRYRGTSFSDFRDLDNEPGENGGFLYVYGREKHPCRVCKEPVRRIVQSGRSSFFCGDCQRTGSAGLVS